jgi:hypothetical protein
VPYKIRYGALRNRIRRCESYDLQVKTDLSHIDGHFIAGFIEGEAHLAVVEQNGGQSYSCAMTLGVRDDDADLLRWLAARTGLGTVHPVPARSTSKPQVRWILRTQADCRGLVELLDRFELRGRKRREYKIWRAAVEVWTSGIANRRVAMRRLGAQLHASREFRVPALADGAHAPADHPTLVAYLHGLLCAEGSFSLARTHGGVTIHLRQDDRPLLAMLAHETGLGHLRDARAYPPARPSTFWRVGKLAEVVAMASWLDPALMRGRKAKELRVWLGGVTEIASARAAGRRADASRMSSFLSEFSAARRYEPSTALPSAETHDRDHRAGVAALQRWATAESGALSCSRYAAYRATIDPTLPNRDTLARRFGSWQAALEAAGLTERAASTAEVRAARQSGGVATRAAHLAAQRERVLTTLRYGVNLHDGTLPTAMEFFRWRLVEAPATPTQATVYRLFPGGWPAVLAAYEASAGQRPWS